VKSVYPIYLHRNAPLPAVVVGGGRVGQRKVTSLLAAGAQVRLVSPTATPHLQELATAGQIEWLPRPYQTGDLDGALLAFAATNERTVNAQVALDARNARILCNVADAPHEGNFHVPAVHRQDDLTIAVGTGGRNPTHARRVRDLIAEWLAAWLGNSAP
jgi:cobalt-precorrin 5A hydrolase / precorrin-3B C17-methyltransferase